MIDEVEKVVVRPVQVLEDKHRRPLVGQLLEEPPPGVEALGPLVLGLLGPGVEADQQAELRLHRACFALVTEQPDDLRVQLLPRLLGGLCLEDADLVLDHLAERPVGHAVAVGQ